jgi:hypothetical protein
MTDRILAREAQAIKRLKKRATAHGKRFLADLIEIGKRLQRAKARVGHGNWTIWLQKNFRMSADSASNYMRLHDLSATPEFRSLRNLPIEALYLLARTPAEIRMAVAERADAGEAITRGTIVSVRAEGETKRIVPLYSQEAPAPLRTLVLTDAPEPKFIRPAPAPEPAPAKLLPQPADANYHALFNAWERASADERRRFLAAIGAEYRCEPTKH